MDMTKGTGEMQVIAEKMRDDFPKGTTLYSIARGTIERLEVIHAIISICFIKDNQIAVLDERLCQLLGLSMEYSGELQEDGEGVEYGDLEEDVEAKLVAEIGNALWNDKSAYKHQSL